MQQSGKEIATRLLAAVRRAVASPTLDSATRNAVLKDLEQVTSDISERFGIDENDDILNAIENVILEARLFDMTHDTHERSRTLDD